MIAIDIRTDRALVFDRENGDICHRDCAEFEGTEYVDLRQENWAAGNFTCIWCEELVTLQWKETPDLFQQHYL